MSNLGLALPVLYCANVGCLISAAFAIADCLILLSLIAWFSLFIMSCSVIIL